MPLTVSSSCFPCAVWRLNLVPMPRPCASARSRWSTAPFVPSCAKVAFEPSFQSKLTTSVIVSGSTPAIDVRSEDVCRVLANTADGCDARLRGERLGSVGRERAEAVVGGHDVVGAHRLLDCVADRAPQALSEDRDEGDEREADHQRRSGGGRAGRVAHRVLARKPAGCTRHLPARPAEDRGERLHEPGRDRRHAEEEDEAAEREQEEHGSDGEARRRTCREPSKPTPSVIVAPAM